MIDRFCRVSENDVILYVLGCVICVWLYYMCWGVIFYETETTFTIINYNFPSYQCVGSV